VSRVEITAGGIPDAARMAALVAAVDTALRGVTPAAQPGPPAYRSRWRRAALLEGTQVPVGIKDGGAAWGGSA
jgi:hypothetical protein